MGPVGSAKTTAACLLKSLAHNLRRDAHDLDVHLQRRDALARTGYLEVHVAVVIFGTRNVGQDGVLVAFFHQTHRNTSNCTL